MYTIQLLSRYEIGSFTSRLITDWDIKIILGYIVKQADSVIYFTLFTIEYDLLPAYSITYVLSSDFYKSREDNDGLFNKLKSLHEAISFTKEGKSNNTTIFRHTNYVVK